MVYRKKELALQVALRIPASISAAPRFIPVQVEVVVPLLFLCLHRLYGEALQELGEAVPKIFHLD